MVHCCFVRHFFRTQMVYMNVLMLTVINRPQMRK